jgi:hypothetical protein
MRGTKKGTYGSLTRDQAKRADAVTGQAHDQNLKRNGNTVARALPSFSRLYPYKKSKWIYHKTKL